jgi:hypothetical protein
MNNASDNDIPYYDLLFNDTFMKLFWAAFTFVCLPFLPSICDLAATWYSYPTPE